MKKLSFQSRIAFNYIVSTAVLTGVLCVIILLVFRVHTNRHYNEIVDANIKYFEQGLSVNNNQLTYNNGYLREDIKAGIRDKRTTYIEIIDNSGNIVYSSPNLQNSNLPQDKSSIQLNEENVKVKKTPIPINGKTEGHFLIGVAAGDA